MKNILYFPNHDTSIPTLYFYSFYSLVSKNTLFTAFIAFTASVPTLKILKRGWKFDAWAGTFPSNFFQGLSFLHLESTLFFAKLSYAFEEKLFFSVTTIL